MNSNLNNQSPYLEPKTRQGNHQYSNPAFKNEPTYSQSPRPEQQPNSQTKPVNNYENDQQKQTPVNPDQQSMGNFCISILLFIIAFILFIIVWVIQKYALYHQVSSHYYLKNYQWAAAHPTGFQFWITRTLTGLSLAIIFQWMMWKIPLMVFAYNCIRRREDASKWVTFIITTFLLLVIDVLLHFLILEVYNSYMYFGFYALLTVILSLFNNRSFGRTTQAFLNSFLPLLCIAVIHIMQVIILPILYKTYSINLDPSSVLFLMVYLFPFYDLLMYAFLLIIGSYLTEQVKTFHQQLHFLTLGYAVGNILLIGYTEVEFYYLIAYYIFRNIFCNYVMYKWDKTLNLPPALSLWIIPYYFSYGVLFLPFCGVGNIITSIGYYSYLLVNTSPQLYYFANSMYASSPFTPTSIFQINTYFQGDIFWIAAFLIWLGLTFSQKYSKKMPQIGYSIVYNIFGIYLFYLGLSSGLAVANLISSSIS